jgi:hypothetical protein
MANALLNSNTITKELIYLYDNMPAISKFADWSYSDKFGKTDRIGTSLSVRRPVQIQAVSDGTWAYNAQTTTDTQVVLALTSPVKYTPFFQDADWGFRVEDFKKRYARNWINSIVNQVDTIIADAISNAGVNIPVSSTLGGNPGLGGGSSVGLTLTGPNWVIYGSGNGAVVNGQTVGNYALLASDITVANQILTDSGIPFDGRIGVLTPKAEGQLLSQAATVFTNYKASSDSYDEGKYVEAFGVKFFTSPNLANHTTGNAWTSAVGVASTITVSAGWTETGSIAVSGLTSGKKIAIGDVFTVGTALPTNKMTTSYASSIVPQTGDVVAVNPLNRQLQANRQQFTVVGVNGYATDATGAVTLTATTATFVVSPAPIFAGDYMNISRQIVAGDKVAVFDSSVGFTGGDTFKESVIFHEKSIAIASPELPDYREMGANTRYERDKETGFGIRTSMTYDGLGVAPGATSQVGVAIRLDLLIGVKLIRPDGIVRIRS